MIESDSDEIYHLSPEELLVVHKGIGQLDNGLFLTNEEANIQADKWLSIN